MYWSWKGYTSIIVRSVVLLGVKRKWIINTLPRERRPRLVSEIVNRNSK